MTAQDGDVAVPCATRMTDYLLGNGHSFAADRSLADELERAVPDIGTVVQLGRTFLRCAVLYLVEAGVRQFLNYGSGIPVAGSVHAIATAADPRCRAVYADTDPIAVAHGQLTLAGDERAAAVQADPRDPDHLLRQPEAKRLLDLMQPVGVLLADVLRFLPEDWDPADVIAGWADRFAPGSHLALAHLTGDARPAETAALVEVMGRSRDPVRPRTRDEIASLFGGFKPVGPGVAGVGSWYRERELDPAEQAAAGQFYVGIGRR
jgi:S-adenosyl methyltransferase